jgi:AcrR family transcriptional regulator
MSTNVKRPYDSSGRRAKAAETRLRIIATAQELFVRQGYGHTTLAQIAEESGVAVETIYAAFRNKATLLRRAWYIAGRGDEIEVTLYDRPEMQHILAEPALRRRNERYAAVTAAFNRRTAALLEMLAGAAASERAARDMLAEWRERRLDVATRYAAAAAATGQLAAEEAEFRDTVYATIEGGLWRQLVGERGWSDERYANWLASLWNADLKT